MNKAIILVLAILFSFATVFTQEKTQPATETPSEYETLAQKTFEAHGGEKLKALKSLSMEGDVDITSSAFNQAFPAKFKQVFAGEKYRLEIDGPVQFVQVFDGQKTVTSPARGFDLPPINRIGFMLIPRYGDDGFVVSKPDDSVKHGFRMTSPDGFSTDFEINKKTNLIKGYSASYVVAGRSISTLVEVDKFFEKDELVIPSKFAQKFEITGMILYAEFKSKSIEANGVIEDSVFSVE